MRTRASTRFHDAAAHLGGLHARIGRQLLVDVASLRWCAMSREKKTIHIVFTSILRVVARMLCKSSSKPPPIIPSE